MERGDNAENDNTVERGDNAENDNTVERGDNAENDNTVERGDNAENDNTVERGDNAENDNTVERGDNAENDNTVERGDNAENDNTVERGDNAGEKHFHLFPRIVFYPFQRQFPTSAPQSICCLQMLRIWKSIKNLGFLLHRAKPLDSVGITLQKITKFKPFPT